MYPNMSNQRIGTSDRYCGHRSHKTWAKHGLGRRRRLARDHTDGWQGTRETSTPSWVRYRYSIALTLHHYRLIVLFSRRNIAPPERGPQRPASFVWQDTQGYLDRMYSQMLCYHSTSSTRNMCQYSESTAMSLTPPISIWVFALFPVPASNKVGVVRSIA